MIDRRKIMLASLAGIVVPVCAVFAQPAPDDRRPDSPTDHGPDQPRAADHGPDQSRAANHGPDQARPAESRPDVHAAAPRPRMPPPRQEVRPRPPGPEASYHWRTGHWNWSGRQWVWVSGVWYR
jgi:hypothetical protein